MSTATAASLLIELGSEELPPKALDELAVAFAHGVCEGLSKRGVGADIGHAKAYCSPRRLAVYVPAVAAAQPDQLQERRGPALNAGLDASGQPTKALLGFAHSCGVEVNALEKLETDRGGWFVHRAIKPGQPTAALIPEILAEALKALPIPRPMRWGDHDYAFVRPVHWLVMLHGHAVVGGEILGVKSGRTSRGHRFHHPQPVHIVDADSWLDALRAAKVLADPVERRARVRSEVERAAPPQATARLSDPLLAEIANLTEWPVAIACTFDRDFLAVPAEVLVTTMETNQKFVSVTDAAGKLTEHFIGVANIDSKDPAEIRKGYERVIRPRFADAKFFYDEDLKTPLATNLDALKSVVYQQALGSVWDKSVRVAELARVIAHRVGADAALATRAAALSKCDLLTRMVGEFPELQGVMGRYYASANGENAQVAAALEEFYAPRFAGDCIAQGKIGQVLSIAERLDTLTGIFAVGMKPSGNKDPFALRRTALGLARTLIEGRVSLDLKAALIEAWEQTISAILSTSHGQAQQVVHEARKKGADAKVGVIGHISDKDAAGSANEIYAFILDRLRGYYADKNISGEAFESVRALAPSDLTDFDQRLHAVVEFAKLPDAQALAAANKRIGNLLRQAGAVASTQVDDALLEAGAERELAAALGAAQHDGALLMATRDYVGLLQRLALLRAPVDRYFECVMVMAENPAVRANRLALLASVRDAFLKVADISLLPAG